MTQNTIITTIQARAIPVTGNDIDTDRIIPARFLKCVTFNELGPHAFEDDRTECTKKGVLHPFDNSNFQGAEILLANKNFGCGSSREHAPQSLMRWGIKAIVAESFAEIFFGNCVSLGIPCATLDETEMAKAQKLAEQNPTDIWTLNIEAESLEGPASFAVHFPSGPKSEFLSGTWNPLQGLLKNEAKIRKVADNLPYMKKFV